MEYISENPDLMMDELHALRHTIQKEYEENNKEADISWYHQQALLEAKKNGYLLTPDSSITGTFKLSPFNNP